MSFSSDATRPVRFLHTADLHLDSPLKSLALRDERLAERVRHASRQVLERLVDTALEHAVDALLIAGDLYDGEQSDVRTTVVLEQALRRLQGAGIPVFVIRGNHDAVSKQRPIRGFPDNVHVFDGRGGHREFADGRAVVHGVSYSKRVASESLLPRFQPAVPGKFNIGMLHTSLAGPSGHDVYAPCSIEELLSFNYDYWALGHIHKRAVHHDHPAIVMPGNPLGRHFNEDGERSITLVELTRAQAPRLRTIDIAPVRFLRLPVSLEGIDSPGALGQAVDAAIGECHPEPPQELLIVRLMFSGQTPLAGTLQREKLELIEQWRAMIADRDDLWIDSFELLLPTSKDTPAPVQPLPRTDGLHTSLLQLIREDLEGNAWLREQLTGELEQLRRKLPRSLHAAPGDSEAVLLEHSLDEWIDEGLGWINEQILEHPGDNDD